MTLLKTNNPLALRLLMTEDLYRIDENTEQDYAITASESVEPPVFDYLGENNKYILILVNEEKSDNIDSADIETLTTILAAKGLELRDVAIVNSHKYPLCNFKQLKQFFSCSKLVLFGINPRQIGLPETDNNHIDLLEGTKVLATYSFKEMRGDVAKKRLFWNEMKKL